MDKLPVPNTILQRAERIRGLMILGEDIKGIRQRFQQAALDFDKHGILRSYANMAVPIGVFGQYTEDDDLIALSLREIMPEMGLDHSADVFNSMIWHIRWAQFGMPTLKLTEKQAASFAISNVDYSSLDEWKLPWKAFLMPVPNGILSCDGAPVRAVSVYQANTAATTAAGLPRRLDGGYIFRVDAGSCAKDSISLWIRGRTENFKQLLEGKLDEDPDTLPVSDAEYTARRLGVTMLINAVSFINHGYEPVQLEHKKQKKGRRASRLQPKPTSYKLDVPVSIDVTKHVRQYMCGTLEEKMYTVRWLVRGHYRQQAYGPGRSQRKRVWIEPFWKGPEAANMKAKDYKLKETKDGQA